MLAMKFDERQTFAGGDEVGIEMVFVILRATTCVIKKRLQSWIFDLSKESTSQDIKTVRVFARGNIRKISSEK